MRTTDVDVVWMVVAIIAWIALLVRLFPDLPRRWQSWLEERAIAVGAPIVRIWRRR